MSLHEIIEKLEKIQEDEEIPSHITILPTENCNAEVTDGDWGDENQVTLSNLPGSQMQALASIHYSDDVESSNDSDDNLPLAQMAKRISEDTSSTASPDLHVNATPSTSTTSVLKTKSYSWVRMER